MGKDEDWLDDLSDKIDIKQESASAFRDKEGDLKDTFEIDLDRDLKRGATNIQNSITMLQANLAGYRVDSTKSGSDKIVMKYWGTVMCGSEMIDNISTMLQPFAQNANIIRKWVKEEWSYLKWEVFTALNGSFLASPVVVAEKYSIIMKSVKNTLKSIIGITSGSRDLMAGMFKGASEEPKEAGSAF